MQFHDGNPLLAGWMFSQTTVTTSDHFKLCAVQGKIEGRQIGYGYAVCVDVSVESYNYLIL